MHSRLSHARACDHADRARWQGAGGRCAPAAAHHATGSAARQGHPTLPYTHTARERGAPARAQAVIAAEAGLYWCLSQQRDRFTLPYPIPYGSGARGPAGAQAVSAAEADSYWCSGTG